jgi:CDP-diacylglycerol--glycerol-3-phosphate 3-phosphatidyltransferase
MSLPNAITLSRVFLGAACLWLLTAGQQELLKIGLAVMVIAELTDFLDGLAARLTGKVSELGKILDPMADSMYRLTVFAAFTQVGWMPAWMLAIFIVRDVGVAYIRNMALQEGLSVAARFSGKAKAVVQGAAQIFAVAVAAFNLEQLQIFIWPALCLAAAVTLYSLGDYAGAVRGKSD